MVELLPVRTLSHRLQAPRHRQILTTTLRASTRTANRCTTAAMLYLRSDYGFGSSSAHRNTLISGSRRNLGSIISPWSVSRSKSPQSWNTGAPSRCQCDPSCFGPSMNSVPFRPDARHNDNDENIDQLSIPFPDPARRQWIHAVESFAVSWTKRIIAGTPIRREVSKILLALAAAMTRSPTIRTLRMPGGLVDCHDRDVFHCSSLMIDVPRTACHTSYIRAIAAPSGRRFNDAASIGLSMPEFVMMWQAQTGRSGYSTDPTDAAGSTSIDDSKSSTSVIESEQRSRRSI